MCLMRCFEICFRFSPPSAPPVRWPSGRGGPRRARSAPPTPPLLAAVAWPSPDLPRGAGTGRRARLAATCDVGVPFRAPAPGGGRGEGGHGRGQLLRPGSGALAGRADGVAFPRKGAPPPPLSPSLLAPREADAMVFKREIKVCRSGAGGSGPVVVSALRSIPGGSPCAPGRPRARLCLLFPLALCVPFYLFPWVCFPFCSAVRICTLTLRIVNRKICILNFYMREEEPTSINININISLYTYKYI